MSVEKRRGERMGSQEKAIIIIAVVIFACIIILSPVTIVVGERGEMFQQPLGRLLINHGLDWQQEVHHIENIQYGSQEKMTSWNIITYEDFCKETKQDCRLVWGSVDSLRNNGKKEMETKTNQGMEIGNNYTG